MRRNNKFVVVISIIISILVIGAVGAYLFLATDIFKSNKELFAKYFIQELQNIENITKLKTIETYKSLENTDKFENKTNIKMIHSEGGEVSNPLNDISAKLDVQKDAEKQYFYANAQILNKNENYMEAEIIRSEQNYGVRFPEVFKQFITIEKDDNVGTIAEELGIEESQLKTVMGIIDGSESIISEEQKNIINTKKTNIFNIFLNGVFEKQKDAMITYNNSTTKTNAYSVKLTNEQVKNIVSEIIEEIDEEEEFPEAQITVYVQKQVPIRTVIEVNQIKIIIENIQSNGALKTKINCSDLSSEEVYTIDAEIAKIAAENQEVFDIKATITQGESSYEVSFLNKLEKVDNTNNIDIELSMKQDITTVSLVLENTVSVGTEFEKLEQLNEENYKSLSKVENKEQRETIIDTVGDMISVNILTKSIGLIMLLNSNEIPDENFDVEPLLSQTDINTFNANFEFYTGEEISANNVKELLGKVKKHLANYEVTELEDNKTNVILNIKKDSLNENGIKEISEKVNDDSKYKVAISYDESNGIVNKITITEM